MRTYKCLLLCVRSSPYTSVRQHQDVFILSCAPESILVAFSRVRLDQNGCFFSCVLTSIFACTGVRLHQKMIPFSRVRLHPNICYFLCAPCLYFLVCIYINFVSFFSCACTFIRMVASTCVRLHKKVVPYSRVRLHPNVCFYLGAPALKCLHFLVCIYINLCKNLLFLVCAYIFMFAFFSCAFTSILRVLVCAYVKKWFLFLVRVFIKIICFFSCALTSKWFLFLVCVFIKMFAFTRVRLH